MGGALGGGVGSAAASPTPSFTKSFNSLLGLKKGIFLAGTSTFSPVFGLRPTRGLRCRVRKLPKPRISILSPARRERTTLSKIVSTMTSLSLRVSSAKRETSSIRSALVITPLFYGKLSVRVSITFSNFRGWMQVAGVEHSNLSFRDYEDRPNFVLHDNEPYSRILKRPIAYKSNRFIFTLR